MLKVNVLSHRHFMLLNNMKGMILFPREDEQKLICDDTTWDGVGDCLNILLSLHREEEKRQHQRIIGDAKGKDITWEMLGRYVKATSISN